MLAQEQHDLHMKSSEVSIKTMSTPASLTIQSQVTKDTTVKWSISLHVKARHADSRSCNENPQTELASYADA